MSELKTELEREFCAFINRKLDEGEERAAQPNAKSYTEDEFWAKHLNVGRDALSTSR